ncbi:hypothetical protein GB937_003368 [Aspergillus fischeri]|nr:hypothetical protein GB937_003368 [Aspergillus fischeri]
MRVPQMRQHAQRKVPARRVARYRYLRGIMVLQQVPQRGGRLRQLARVLEFRREGVLEQDAFRG